MSFLAHHGILGQKWGVRRFQNKDGSLTAEGKKRFLNSDGSLKPNKIINGRDYGISTTLSRVKRNKGKKYSLTKNQKKYMDESGNLTLEGGRKTLPLGHDLTRYKTLAKERSAMSSAWKKYFNDRTQKNYEDFIKSQKILFDKISEIDVEEGRKWILENVR